MKPLAYTRKVSKFLEQVSDEGTFQIVKKRGGQQRIVARFGGQKRSFTLPGPSTFNIERQLKYSVNQFLDSLSLENTPVFHW